VIALKCPFCGFEESKVIDSRPTDEGERIRRRRVYMEQLEKAVSEIEAVLQNSLDREVTTVYIGELAMEKLKSIDEVAYVRFASVYRQFKDINTFMDELAKLLKEK
jgi:transcriptional repressor NrdR